MLSSISDACKSYQKYIKLKINLNLQLLFNKGKQNHGLYFLVKPLSYIRIAVRKRVKTYRISINELEKSLESETNLHFRETLYKI